MAIACTEATGASHWASYFINGDASGLTSEEKAQADAWLAQQAPWYPVADIEDSDRFTWFYELHTGIPCAGGNVTDYIMHMVTP